MSGQVQQAKTQSSTTTVCPIVIDKRETIITYKTASNVSVPSDVNAAFSGCSPTLETIAYANNVLEIPKCCTGVQSITKNIFSTY